jgi:hypothetical protein
MQCSHSSSTVYKEVCFYETPRYNDVNLDLKLQPFGCDALKIGKYIIIFWINLLPQSLIYSTMKKEAVNYLQRITVTYQNIRPHIPWDFYPVIPKMCVARTVQMWLAFIYIFIFSNSEILIGIIQKFSLKFHLNMFKLYTDELISMFLSQKVF